MRRAACFHASRARKLCYSYVTRTAKRSGYKDTLREFCARRIRDNRPREYVSGRVGVTSVTNSPDVDERFQEFGWIDAVSKHLWFINKKWWWSSRRRLEGDEYRSCMLNELR